MTRDDIIRMAVAAGFPERRAFSDLSDLYLRLERFAALVAAAESKACEAIAEQQLYNTAMLTSLPPQSAAAWSILNAIRARSEN